MDKCKKCGAEMVVNPKTGKSFCKEKCWLNNPQPTNFSSKVAQVKTLETMEDAKWDKINEKKEQSMRWMNALNNATLLAAHGKITTEQIKYSAQKIYEMWPIGTQENKVVPAEVPTINIDDFGDMENKIDQIPF